MDLAHPLHRILRMDLLTNSVDERIELVVVGRWFSVDGCQRQKNEENATEWGCHSVHFSHYNGRIYVTPWYWTLAAGLQLGRERR